MQPNIMFTLDNSGSMDFRFAPMWVTRWIDFNNDTEAELGRYCKLNWRYNSLYYNPNTVYLPPITPQGTARFANAEYSRAWINGFRTNEGTINLSSEYSDLGNWRSNYDRRGDSGAYYAEYRGPAAAFDPQRCFPDNLYQIVRVNNLSAAEQQNFANWYSYYRTRMLSMKTAVGEAFRTVDERFRVGFHTINRPSNGGVRGDFIPVETFSGAHRQKWYNSLYAQSPEGGTPLLEAASRIGEYFRVRKSPATGDIIPTSQDPIQFSCQQNYHFLSTDGQWNGTSVSLGNNDRILPNNPALLTALGQEFGTIFNAGDPWPRPYRENPNNPSAESLADIAAFYWMNDLRPNMANNVSTSSLNRASWQHVVSFGIAFSEQGTIPYPDGLRSIMSGTSEWPFPKADEPSAVDDLWHFALNGHGQYFNVSSPAELTAALGKALNDIRSRAGSLSGGQLNSSDLTSGNAVAFRAGFVAGDWVGDVAAYSVEPSTGTASTIKLWSAREKLDALVQPAGSGGGWQNKRKVVTWRNDTDKAVPFQWSNLSPAQQNTLTSDPSIGAKMVEYLRGDRSQEDDVGVTRLFRKRLAVMGDIVGSETEYVAKPGAPYSESYHPGYDAFKIDKANRRPMIYVGSNAGMLHAIDATVGKPDSGKELWSFVPGMSYQPGIDGLAGLTYRLTDPIPNQFEHRYRVDATPFVTDIDFGQTVGGSGVNWRSLLVSGMNKGGKGYFAIDVTNPDASTEAGVASKVLWQFTGDVPNDPRMGYSYGEPLVFKTRRFGWVVAVSSGYNNAAGTGHIWLLNPRTGKVLHRFDSRVGSPAVPSGLTRTNIYMPSSRLWIADQIYATDLMGNLHRFDVSAANAADWKTTGETIIDVGQALTTAPVIADNPFNPAERWVFLGSGRLLSDRDISAAASSAMYAVKDGGSTGPATFTRPLAVSDLVPLDLSQSIRNSPQIKGWYAAMPTGQYITTAATITRGAVVWSTTVPTRDPCAPGATSDTYVRAIGDAANLVIGGVSIPSNSNVVKTTTVRLLTANPTNSKKRYKLTFDRGDGTTGPGSKDMNLDFTLTGGRTGVRILTTQ